MFGGQLTSALVTGVGNLLLLGAIWLVVGFGVFSILRWIAARFVQLLGASLTLLVRAPLLLFFSLVTFFTNEYWQLFGDASDVIFARRRDVRADHRDLPDRSAPGAACATWSRRARSRCRSVAGSA